MKTLTLFITSAFLALGQSASTRYLSCVAASNSGSAYTCNVVPAIGAYSSGFIYAFKADVANTGACSINLNGLGAVTIKKYSSGSIADLSSSDIGAGQWVTVRYDGTYMQIVGGPGGSGGSVTVPGTSGQVQTGNGSGGFGTPLTVGVDLLGTGNPLVAGFLDLFPPSDATHSIGWVAPDTRSTQVRLKLPAADPAAGQILTYSAPSSNVSTASWVALANQTVYDNGTAKTQRAGINFISGTNSTVSCADNLGSNRTDCTVSSTGGGGGGGSGVATIALSPSGGGDSPSTGGGCWSVQSNATNVYISQDSIFPGLILGSTSSALTRCSFLIPHNADCTKALDFVAEGYDAAGSGGNTTLKVRLAFVGPGSSATSPSWGSYSTTSVAISGTNRTAISMTGMDKTGGTCTAGAGAILELSRTSDTSTSVTIRVGYIGIEYRTM